MVTAGWELFGLFISAFTSATLLPGSSEAVLAGIIAFGTASTTSAVIIATLGNMLGSVVNWVMGLFAAHFRHHRRFPLTPEQYERYSATYAKWGVWSLLLSWTPVIGDPLTVVAGVMRTPLWIFLPLVMLAKGARYLVVAGVVQLF
jgi:membrane protein YqaA with SNARE-associated domain